MSAAPFQPPTPVVVCSIGGPDEAALKRKLAEVPGGSGLVEIRADRIPPTPLEKLVREAGRPVIVSARRREDGGAFEGSEAERSELLGRALGAGAAFVDVELGSPAAGLAQGPEASRVILSSHLARCCLDDLLEAHSRLAASPAGRLKIVPRAETAAEILAVREFLTRVGGAGRPVACFAAGRAGMLSRLLAPAWGSWATYGAASLGEETGEGQFTASELVEVYDVLAIRPSTRLFALVGSAVRRSPSPAMYAAAFWDLGLDARYAPVEVERFDELLPLVSGLGLAGLAVTMPFKEVAAARAALRDEVSRAAGAVNTVLFEGERWSGYNTDGPAAVALARRRIELRGLRVAVIGAGGTGRAMVAAFQQAGSRVTLFNRDPVRARRVAGELGVEARVVEELPGWSWDLLVHCTPLGSRGQAALVPPRLAGRVVLDVVYEAEPTPLVRAARAEGVEVIDGLELLVEQAVLQCELLTARRPDPEVMLRTGRVWLERLRSRVWDAPLDAPRKPA